MLTTASTAQAALWISEVHKLEIFAGTRLFLVDSITMEQDGYRFRVDLNIRF